jgi:hypothetical protein
VLDPPAWAGQAEAAGHPENPAEAGAAKAMIAEAGERSLSDPAIAILPPPALGSASEHAVQSAHELIEHKTSRWRVLRKRVMT